LAILITEYNCISVFTDLKTNIGYMLDKTNLFLVDKHQKLNKTIDGKRILFIH